MVNKKTPDFACMTRALIPRNRSTPDFACMTRALIPRNRSAQMKIQQMVFMIIAVTFLFVLVGLFFLSIIMQNLQKTATNLAEKEATLLVSKLANSPELSCENAFGSSRTDCVDFDKVIILSENKDKFSGFWGVAKIEIRKVYPDSGNIECNMENYPNCGVLKILDKNVKTLPSSSSFISLCRKKSGGTGAYDKCELARLMVSSEDKTQ
ncbi:Uncharacterised protein [uncultured archaeon]|nr:Uncharacterised protein [uncultured archaeon]